jgi:hypothetical protein
MQWKVAWILIVAFVLIAVLIPVVNYVLFHNCVDGGGRWDHEKRQCVGGR